MQRRIRYCSCLPLICLSALLVLSLDWVDARRASSAHNAEDEYDPYSMTTAHPRYRSSTGARYSGSPSNRYGSSSGTSDTSSHSRYRTSHDSDSYRATSRLSSGNARHSPDRMSSGTTTAPRGHYTASRYSSGGDSDYFGYPGRPSRQRVDDDGYGTSSRESRYKTSSSRYSSGSDYGFRTTRAPSRVDFSRYSSSRSSSAADDDYSYPSGSSRYAGYSATTKKPSSFGKVMSSITGMLGGSSGSSLGTHKTGSSSGSGGLSAITSLLGGSKSGAPGSSGSGSLSAITSLLGGSKSGASGSSGSSSGMSKFLMPALTYGGKYLAKMVAKKFSGSKSGHSTGALAATGVGIGGTAGLIGYNRGSGSSHDSGYVPPMADSMGYPAISPGHGAAVPPPNRVIPIGQPITTTAQPRFVPQLSGRTVAPFLSFTSTVRSADGHGDSDAHVDPCLLVQWNYEYKFTELPDLLIGMTANDSASGETVQDKFNFFQAFVEMIAEMAETADNSEAVFIIPEGYAADTCREKGHNRRSSRAVTQAEAALSTRCDIARRMRMNLPECTTGQEHAVSEPVSEWTFTTRPVQTSIHDLQSVYLNPNRSINDFQELGRSIQRCYAQNGRPKDDRMQSCLDFSIDPQQVLTLNHQSSLFGNDEVCRRFLNFDLLACAAQNPNEERNTQCSLDDLLVINAFSRNIYLCSNEIDPETIEALQRRGNGES